MTKKRNRTKTRSTRSRLVRKWDGRQAARMPANANISIRTLRSRLNSDPADAEARILIADRLVARNKANEALELLDAPDSPLLGEHRDPIYWDAMRIRGFALARMDEFEEAHKVALEIQLEFPAAPDGYYLAAYSTNRLALWEDSRSHAEQFIICIVEPAPTDDSGSLWTTGDRLYEIYNYLGAAQEKLGNSDLAVGAFKNAIEDKPTFDLAWMNLVRALKLAGRQNEAESTIREALKVCPRSRALKDVKTEELRPSNSSEQEPGDAVADGNVIPSRQSIALCMIVKNEEEHLPNALASAKPLVDQIIIVDTGSTDRTVEIAESYGAQVYHHEWEGNFSKARNISMGYADADWILILDADEELIAEDLQIIRNTIETTDMRAISVSVYNYSREQRMYTSFLPSVRLFRRDLGAYYDGIVHNQLRFPTEEGVLRIPARIQHFGYGLSPEVMARKVARTQGLLEKQLSENADNAFAHFNLAQLLRGTEDTPTPVLMDKVIYHAGRAVDLTSPDERNERHIHLMALHQLVTAYFNKGDHERAAEYAHRALAHKPGYLDAILSLGHIHSMDGQYDLAQKYYLEYLDRQKSYDEHAEVDHVILLHLRSRHNAYYGLGLVSEMQGNTVESVGWYDRCIEERDDYIDVHFRLATALAAIGQKDRARRELKTELNHHPKNTEARIALVDLLSEVNETNTASQCLEEGLNHDADSAVLAIRLGLLDMSERMYRDALQHFEIVPSDHEQSPMACRLRADAHFELKEYDEAVMLYEGCLTETPDDINLLNNLGNCHFKLGAYARAESIYHQIINAGQASAHVYRNLGLTQARMDKTDDAIFTLESYAELNPEDIETTGFLGDLHFSTKNFARAIDEYERVLEHQPNRPDTLTRLGDCYLNQGAIAAALVGYERALDADPDYKPAWARLRDVREHLVAQFTKMPESPGQE